MTPSRASERVSLVTLGGAFIGLWLVITVTNHPEWLGWGLLGVGIGAGLYGGRIVGEGARYVLWTLVGLSIGGLVGLAIIDPHVGLVATLVTFAGSAFLAASLPVPMRDGTPETAPSSPGPAATRWTESGITQTSGEPPYAQQQTVTVMRR